MPPEDGRISIVIPTVNRLPLLQRAVESALAQSVSVRVVVSDNGSNDGTWEYLQSLTDPRLEIHRIEQTIGAPEHTEYLQRWLSTEWITFLSDDDYLDPGFIEGILSHVDRYPCCRMVYSRAFIHVWDQSYIGQGGPDIEEGWQFFQAFLSGQRDPCWCAIAVRTEDLKRIGVQPSDRHIGDMYYWTRILRDGAIGCVQRPLSHYIYIRENTDSVTSGLSLDAWRKESLLLAGEMLSAIALQPGAYGSTPKEARRVTHRFLAHTCSNQCIWNIVRGHPRLALLYDLRKCLPHLLWHPSVWPRVAGACLLPHWGIRWRVESHIRGH